MKSDRPDAPANLLAAIKRLYGHFPANRKRQLVLVMALILAGAIAELATLGAVVPFLSLIVDPQQMGVHTMLQSFLARMGWNTSGSILVAATLLFAGVVLIAAAVRVLLTWVSQKFVFQLGQDLSTEVYRRILHQPYDYHLSVNTSELIAGHYKVESVIMNILLPLILGFSAAVLSVFIIGALIVIDAEIALLAGLGFGLIYLVVTFVNRGRLRINSKVVADAHTELVQTVQEGLGGIRDVLIDQAQPVYLDQFKRINLALRDAQVMNAFIGAAPRFVIEAFVMILIAVLALVMSADAGGLTEIIPVLGALALGAQRLLPLSQRLYASWAQISGFKQSLLDVLGMLELPIHSRHTTADAVSPLPFEQEIVLDHLTFQYGNSHTLVLKDVNLSIKKGSRVGFVGKTGSGKSTIIDLVMGLLEPTGGAVRIDGKRLTPDNVPGWQKHIAHVPQFIYLADTTIAQNIAFGVLPDRIDSSRVFDAARQAELSEFIESLPDGYQTMVGERGTLLSGGQRQRIGIARALYKNASVLVFDEATNALDNATEAAVMTSISNLDRELTILIVAHRLSTVSLCDKVVMLEAGRIVADET